MMIDEGEKKTKVVMTMTPWEQHSTVISMPRYDYKAPSLLLQRSHSGFLITCTIKREKSATKEAIAILEKHVQKSSYKCCYRGIECGNADETTDKRRKIYSDEEMNGEFDCTKHIASTSNLEDSGEPSKDAKAADMVATGGLEFSLLKLTRSGLVLFTLPEKEAPDTVETLLNIMQSLGSGDLTSPLWCHRILPIQATCILNEKELHTVVSHLVARFISDSRNELAFPVKFAVAYNRRGLEETLKSQKNKTGDDDSVSLLDRNICFATVAAAVKHVIPDSSVDLKTPQICVFVELLPLSGVPKGSFVAAVSVLPQCVVTTKPKLCVKPLASFSYAKN